MSTKELLSIAEVYEMTPGDKDSPVWVDEFTGVVNSIEQKQGKESGKKFWTCVIGDLTSPAEIQMSVFTAPKFSEGDVIEVTGQGMRRTEYNSTAQVTISKNTQVLKVAQSAHHQEQQQRKAESAPAVNGKLFTVRGETVGMAMNNALDILTKHFDTRDQMIERICHPNFWASVHDLASDIIREARALEAGKLAPSVRDRNGGVSAQRGAPAQPPVQPKPAPRANPRDDDASKDAPGNDEEVPF
jgi:hypothetical protein